MEDIEKKHLPDVDLPDSLSDLDHARLRMFAAEEQAARNAAIAFDGQLQLAKRDLLEAEKRKISFVGELSEKYSLNANDEVDANGIIRRK